MRKKIYIAPDTDYIEFVLESCLATSTPEDSDVHGETPDPWGKGNEDWW